MNADEQNIGQLHKAVVDAKNNIDKAEKDMARAASQKICAYQDMISAQQAFDLAVKTIRDEHSGESTAWPVKGRQEYEVPLGGEIPK